jgi:ATP-binding cassette subfamily F protein uup
MAELGLKGVTHSFGGPLLLDDVTLQLEKGERIGLLGRNGCGKSTLLGILGGTITPDDGEVLRRKGVRIAGLAQAVPDRQAGTVRSHVEAAATELGGSDLGEWEVERRVDAVLAQLVLDPTAEVRDLSAGSKRRVMLARALVAEPDVLLLDEPTNHLDIEAIGGLEDFLQRRAGVLMFVTHDRAFLKKLATRIIDLDRGALRSYDCGYETYLERRDAELEAEAGQNAEFDKKLAQEEAWLRKGIRARRTRNMGRVRALRAMRVERSERRDVVGRARARVQDAERTGQVVLRAKGLGHSFGDKRVLGAFDTEIQRGDRIGLVGPNGCGKTTLVKLLLGQLTPQEGTVKRGTKLEIASFDQLHSVLDDTKTLQENVCDHGDTVTIGGKSRHIVGYLQDFLFTPDQVRGSIARLSGGERNRVQLARILARPCNLLVLDEPTNDLDLETLELLEELLLDYQGTLLVVSHDRAFLDNVVTSTMVFEGDGRVREYVGGYADWLELAGEREPPKARAKAAAAPARSAETKPRRLTYMEKKELDALPDRIERLEAEKTALEARMSRPDFYAGPGDAIAEATKRFETLTADLAEAYDKWTLFEGIASGEITE